MIREASKLWSARWWEPHKERLQERKKPFQHSWCLSRGQEKLKTTTRSRIQLSSRSVRRCHLKCLLSNASLRCCKKKISWLVVANVIEILHKIKFSRRFSSVNPRHISIICYPRCHAGSPFWLAVAPRKVGMERVNKILHRDCHNWRVVRWNEESGNNLTQADPSHCRHAIKHVDAAFRRKLAHRHLHEVRRLSDQYQNDQVGNHERSSAVFCLDFTLILFIFYAKDNLLPKATNGNRQMFPNPTDNAMHAKRNSTSFPQLSRFFNCTSFSSLETLRWMFPLLSISLSVIMKIELSELTLRLYLPFILIIFRAF